MSESRIHPTAIVADGATLAAGVIVEPYAIIEDEVSIGADTVIGAHAVIRNWVRIGERNRISPQAVIGEAGQDLSYDGGETWVEIGDDNVLREGVTVHRATRAERPTRIGSHCFFMAYSHVAHDCEVGDHVILTNQVCLGGHVTVGDYAILGGGTMVHQFVRVGAYAMVAGYLAVRKDVLPYSLVAGAPIKHYRLNTIGLRRRGIRGERYRALESAFRAVRSGEPLPAADTPETAHLAQWLGQPSKRGRYGFAGPDAADDLKDIF